MFKAEGIVKRYSNHVALNNVSFDVPEKSIYGLLGPNGAGKTSMIRIINQITGPDEGTCYIGGEKLKPEHVERIGYLPEERGLYKKMKVGEQAMYLARLKGLSRVDARKQLKEWFERFEIGAWWGKKVEELSKGMAQKVQFITTVLHEPKLLIFDEPFSGFDPINAQLIRNEILRLRDEGATVILSTHNMGSVEEICDHICLINNSKAILKGNIKEIKKTYRTNVYEINFKGNMIAFTNALWTGSELLEHEQVDDRTVAKIKMMEGMSPNDLLKGIIQHVEVFSLNEVIPSMNDIFIRVVQEKQEPAPTEMEVNG